MQAMFPMKPNASAIKSVVLFFGTIVVGITYWLNPASRAIQGPLERFLALVTGTFLGWFNSSVSVSHTAIQMEAFTANIVPACTGLFTMTMYVAAVLAFPCSLAQKAKGVALGVGSILALNWVRISSLMVIGAYWHDAFEFAHLVVWQTIAIIFAVFVWLFWVQRVVHAH